MRTKDKTIKYFTIVFIVLLIAFGICAICFSGAWFRDYDDEEVNVTLGGPMTIRLQDIDDSIDGVKSWNVIYDSTQTAAYPGDTLVGKTRIDMGTTSTALIRSKISATVEKLVDEETYEEVDLTQTFAPQAIGDVQAPTDPSDATAAKAYNDALDSERPQKEKFDTEQEYLDAYAEFQAKANVWNCFLLSNMTQLLELNENMWQYVNGWMYYRAIYDSATATTNIIDFVDQIDLSIHLTKDLQDWKVTINLEVEAMQSQYMDSPTHPWYFDIALIESLTPDWERQTITFACNGGEEVSPLSQFAGTKLTLPTPTRTGYSFVGWFSDEALTTQFTSTTMPEQDTTLHAKWTANTYSIAYDANGGTGSMTNSTHTYDVEKALTANSFTRSGYVFDGWATSEGGAVVYADGASVKNLIATNGKTVTLYAHWATTNYSITYVLDGGTNNTNNPTSYTIETATITLANPTKTGYMFAGWFSEASFTTQVTSIAKGSTGDKTLHAKWTASTYEVTFENHYQNWKYLSYGCTGNWDSSKETFAFTADNTSSGGPYMNGMSKLLVVGQKYRLTFKAKASRSISPNIKVEFGKNNLSDENCIIQKTNLTTSYQEFTFDFICWRTGYSLCFYSSTWEAGDTFSIKDISFSRIVTFDEAYGELPTPTRTGYTFAGWFSEASHTTEVTSATTVSTATAHTLYAKWTATSYSINYVLEGGTNNTNNPSTYTIETATTALLEPTKTGYEFEGWFSEASYTTQVTSIEKGSTGDKILYAKWSAITYSITYELNGGTNNTNNPSTYTIETATTMLFEPTKTGYEFEGWFSEASYTTQVTSIENGSTGDKILYAKWSVGQYTISFNSNGGTEVESITQDYGSEVTKPTDPTRANYKFDGWYEDEELTTAYVFDTMPASDITLYAKWTAIFETDGKGTVTGLTEYGKKLSAINIPNELDDVTITAIGQCAFIDCTNMASITIPSSVTSIEDPAFYGCSGLESITVASDNTAYKSEGNCLLTKDGKTLILGCKNSVIPSSVTSIGNSAFSYCSGLTSITIPEGVTSIGNCAFSYCSGLTSITIPEGVTSIGSLAFFGCSSLSSIVIPSGVTLIENETFTNCTNLRTVTFASDSQLTTIRADAFLGCSSLTGVTIPDGVTSMEKGVFYGCNRLEMVIFGENSKLSSMEYAIFSGCSSLTSIVIPSGVTLIEDGTFADCSSLTDVYYLSTKDDFSNIEIGDDNKYFEKIATIYYYSASMPENMEGYWHYVDGVPKVWSYADVFEYTGGTITGLTDDGATLTSITIPSEIDGVAITTIGANAFSGNTTLTSVTISDGVTTIGESAFAGCTNLASVTIPSSVTSIGQLAFSDTQFLTGLSSANGIYSCSDGKKIAIKSTGDLTSIDLTDVYLIADCAFSSCSGSWVVLPQTMPTIGKQAFGSSLKYVFTWNWYEDKIAEDNANLTSATMCLYHETKPTSAFEYDGGYLWHYVAGVPTTWQPPAEYVFEYSKDIINGLTAYGAKLTAIEIPSEIDGVEITEIGAGAFENCTFTSLTFESGNKAGSLTIGPEAFYGCSGLTSIVLTSRIGILKDHVFAMCSGLKEVTISGKIDGSNIGEGIFFGCHNIEVINYGGDEKAWESVGWRDHFNFAGVIEDKVNYNVEVE